MVFLMYYFLVYYSVFIKNNSFTEVCNILVNHSIFTSIYHSKKYERILFINNPASSEQKYKSYFLLS